MNRRKTEGMCAWTILNASKMTKLFFKHVITGDESGFWNTILTPNDKVQSGTRATHRAQRKKERKNEQIKIMLICFFDSQGFVHKEFVPQGQTVNKQYYREVLERLMKSVHHVRPEIADTWLLHHDNAPCHTAIFVKEVLAKKVFQWFRSHHTRLI
jgi:hypothetical protein